MPVLVGANALCNKPRLHESWNAFIFMSEEIGDRVEAPVCASEQHQITTFTSARILLAVCSGSFYLMNRPLGVCVWV